MILTPPIILRYLRSKAALLGFAALPFAVFAGTEITAGDEEALLLPSGLDAHLQEMLWDRPGGGLVYRFRFVAAAFSGETEFELLMGDLEYLCTEFALPKLANTGPQPSQIIISLADKPSEFGIYDPEDDDNEGGAPVDSGTVAESTEVDAPFETPEEAVSPFA